MCVSTVGASRGVERSRKTEGTWQWKGEKEGERRNMWLSVIARHLLVGLLCLCICFKRQPTSVVVEDNVGLCSQQQQNTAYNATLKIIWQNTRGTCTVTTAQFLHLNLFLSYSKIALSLLNIPVHIFKKARLHECVVRAGILTQKHTPHHRSQ